MTAGKKRKQADLPDLSGARKGERKGVDSCVTEGGGGKRGGKPSMLLCVAKKISKTSANDHREGDEKRKRKKEAQVLLANSVRGKEEK